MEIAKQCLKTKFHARMQVYLILEQVHENKLSRITRHCLAIFSLCTFPIINFAVNNM